MATAAERQRRRRQRLKAGRMRVAFDVDEVNHVEMLIATGFLRPEQCDDRAAINDATRRLTETLVPADLYSRHA